MADIEIGFRGIPEPTICGPVSDFKELTLSSNAIRMGEYGVMVGLAAAALFYIGWFYVAPRVYQYGTGRGWWS